MSRKILVGLLACVILLFINCASSKKQERNSVPETPEGGGVRGYDHNQDTQFQDYDR